MTEILLFYIAVVVTALLVKAFAYSTNGKPNDDTATIVKATEDLDAAGNKLKDAVDKNKPK